MKTYTDKTNNRDGIIISISDANFILKNAVKETDKWGGITYRLDKFYAMQDVVIGDSFIEGKYKRYSLKYSEAAMDILGF